MKHFLILAATALALAACGESEPEAPAALEISWPNLLPEGEADRLRELQADIQMMSQIDHIGGPAIQVGTFNVVEELIGERIRMPGFILPLEYEAGGTISEFLLVPFVGACVHTPPPPPNQIVYVTSPEPVLIEGMWDPVWVTGILSSDPHMNELGDAAYTLTLERHEPYEM